MNLEVLVTDEIPQDGLVEYSHRFLLIYMWTVKNVGGEQGLGHIFTALMWCGIII